VSAEVPNSIPQPTGSSQPPQATTPVVTPPAVAAAPVEVTPVPDPLAHLPIPFQGVSFALKGYHAAASVNPDQVVFAAEQLDKEGFALDTITGVDWLAEGQMEVVYDYFHPATGLRAVVRSRVPRSVPEIPTISAVYPGANWHEREAHDFFGIRFLGHPNLAPFLLPEDATYHPLRKDFTA
jgi:NADH:ubiquinone oxidoreductase subunit C